MRYIGIDYGAKRIGIAVSDEGGKVAFPLCVVEAGKNALSEIAVIVKEKSAQKVVIGESRNFKNEPNTVQEEIDQFKNDLTQLLGVPVEYEPEFLTSAQAARSGGEDASAAALILQSFLDKLKQ